MVLCVATGCNQRSERSPGISFFQFPKDEQLKKLWLENLNRGSFEPSVHHKLCSKHFENDQFRISPGFAERIGYDLSFRLRLKDDAVPTIFKENRPEKRPTTERHSAKNMLEKRIKPQIKLSLKSHQHDVNIDQSSSVAEEKPFIVQVSETCEPIHVTTTTGTVTTASLSTSCADSSVDSVMCPLTWFATLAVTKPKLDASHQSETKWDEQDKT